MKDVKASHALHDILIEHVSQLQQIDAIVALESRGFLFGPQVAHYLGVPLIPIRKKGKLPGEVEQVSYGLEYGMVNEFCDCIYSLYDIFTIDCTNL